MNNGQGAAASEPQTAIVPAHESGLRMRTSPAESLQRFQELQAFVAKVMVIDVDYGKVPGTDKVTLFKPGAEKLCEIYGFVWEIRWTKRVEDWEKGFFYFEAEVILRDRSGVWVGNGIGSCNSREDKYAFRWEWEDQLRKEGIDTKKLPYKSKQFSSGLKFRVPNTDPYSLVNTIQKMAVKRAFVGAVVAATRSSGIFSTDLEDMPQDILEQLLGSADEVRSWEQGTAAEQKAGLVEKLVEQLAKCTNDGEVKAIGATMVTLVKTGQLSSSDERLLREKIDEKRKAIAAAKPPEQKPEAKPADAPKAPDSTPKEQPAKEGA